VTYEVYLIGNRNHWYVGSTNRDAMTRFKELTYGTNPSPVRAKLRELGPDAFELTVLERSSTGDPIEAEARWYDWYLAHDPRQTLNGHRPHVLGPRDLQPFREDLPAVEKWAKETGRLK
jgi:hypothetical protein